MYLYKYTCLILFNLLKQTNHHVYLSLLSNKILDTESRFRERSLKFYKQ